jgi:hypothetical protein
MGGHLIIERSRDLDSRHLQFGNQRWRPFAYQKSVCNYAANLKRSVCNPSAQVDRHELRNRKGKVRHEAAKHLGRGLAAIPPDRSINRANTGEDTVNKRI